MQNKQTDELEEILKDLALLIKETAKELATSKDPTGKKQPPSLGKISYLLGIAKEILNLIHQRTKDPKEARFIANVIKAAIEHWYPQQAK